MYVGSADIVLAQSSIAFKKLVLLGGGIARVGWEGDGCRCVASLFMDAAMYVLDTGVRGQVGSGIGRRCGVAMQKSLGRSEKDPFCVASRSALRAGLSGVF